MVFDVWQHYIAFNIHQPTYMERSPFNSSVPGDLDYSTILACLEDKCPAWTLPIHWAWSQIARKQRIDGEDSCSAPHLVRTAVRLLGMRTEIDGRESIPPSSEITLAISPYKPRIRVSEVHSSEELIREALLRAPSPVLPAAQVILLAFWIIMHTVALLISFIFLKVYSLFDLLFLIEYFSCKSLI